MDVGTALSVVQTLFAALQCSELKELFSFLNYESELEQLERTVGTVRAVLTDAASNRVQVDTSQAHQYLDELKYAVYDAEDLLDEFVTLAKSKKFIKGGSVSNQVRLLLSPFNSLDVARKMSEQVKVLSNGLREIADRHSTYGFKLDSRPTCRTIRAETVSHVNEGDIIGRKEDVEDIVGRLLDSNGRRDVSCLPIVGLGGLGKAALAKLVYNDSRIEKEFSKRLWTCVSDQDEENLNAKAILSKILESATRKNHGDLAKETIHKELQAELAGKKCLIVLDDVWSENCLELPSLVEDLRIGLRGSWIVLTTRSQETARIVGNEYVHHLKGLSEEDSWNLFRRIAFGQADQELANPCPDLVKVGKDIVEKCANVPQAIKVVASLLRGQDKRVWGSFQEKEIGKLKVGKKDGVEPILKLSYDHLQLPLKTCFSYCAVFPKDYEIKKRKLIDLWMAQGYIIPQEGQSVEDTGEEYFSILLNRSFFQDVKKDEYGEVVSCKIHDLMHDIAEEVAGKEVYRADLSKTRLDENKVRHVSFIGSVKGTKLSSTKSKIRTCLFIPSWWGQYENVDNELENWVCLSALDLRWLSIASLPSALGKLLHLRYLDLSNNDYLQVLPESITKLHNLQTLKLRWFGKLKELPIALGELLHLRYLDLSWNDSLEVLPNSIVDLHNLQTLKVRGCIRLKELPSALGGLFHLKYLDLFANASLELLPNSIADLQSLQTLILKECEKLKELPSAMGKLLHLRHLDLAVNRSLQVLPNSIGDLHNLQTLKLRSCWNLNALPEDFSNLVNLKVLDIDSCEVLRRMPRGMGKLRNLEKLLLFVAGDETSTLKHNIVHQMEELGALAGLRGSLDIRILKNTEYVEGGVREGGHLRNKEHLTCVRIRFPYFDPEETSLGSMAEDEQRLLLQHLRPHSNLRELSLEFYHGSRIPSWAPEDDLATVVPNLTQLHLWDCPGLQYLPLLRHLGNLKTLLL